MKTSSKWLLSLVCALSVMGVANVAQACQCRVSPAHWSHGYYFPNQCVCCRCCATSCGCGCFRAMDCYYY